MFGVYGIIISWILIVSHLARMESFKFPYLMPIASDDVNDNEDKKDLIVRFPLYKLKKKKIYVRPEERNK